MHIMLNCMWEIHYIRFVHFNFLILYRMIKFNDMIGCMFHQVILKIIFPAEISLQYLFDIAPSRSDISKA